MPAVLAAALACALAPSPAVADPGGQAVSFQIDTAHDGYQPSPDLTLPLQKQWSVTLPQGTGVNSIVDSPVVVGGVVYATAGANLYAISLATGDTLWQKALGGTYLGVAPTYDNGLIYVGNDSGMMWGLDPTSGATVWSHDLQSDPDGNGLYWAPTAADGRVYINNWNGTLFALMEATGTLSWSTSLAADTIPAVSANGVYALGACEHAYDLDPFTGAIIWHYDNSGGSVAGGGIPAVLGDGNLYGHDSCVGNMALSAATGANQGPFVGTSSPAIANGVLYTLASGTLEAVSSGGLGSVSWTFTPTNDSGELNTSPVVAGSVVYVGSSSGDLYAVDATTGSQLWSTDVGVPMSGVNGAGEGDSQGLAVADQALVVPGPATLTAYADGSPTVAATGTTLAADPSPVPLGQTSTLTATVTGSDGGGTVSFSVNGTPITGCSSQPLTGAATATATCTPNSLPGGPDNVEAQYSGDSGYYESAGWVSLTVDRVATTTSVTASPSGSAQGASVVLTATVGATDGGGSVDFSVGGSDISGCGAVSLTSTSQGEAATCTTNSLPVGTNEAVTATYSGDNAYDTSSGSTDVTVQGPTATYTWTGQSVGSSWSSPSDWEDGISPNGTVAQLNFPALSGSACDPPTGAASCYLATNDIAGLDTTMLYVDGESGYVLNGDGLTVGNSGVSIGGTTGVGTPPIIDTPITLGAAQQWNIDAGPAVFGGPIDGNFSLEIFFNADLAGRPPTVMEPRSQIEVGNISGYNDGGLYLDGNTQVNSTDGNGVTMAQGAGVEVDGRSNAVGSLSIGGSGWLSIGAVDDGAGELAVNGTLGLSGAAGLAMAIDAPGTQAGVDYSQITATGDMWPADAPFSVTQGTDAAGNCDDLGVGQTLTLLSTSGVIHGSIGGYADGAAIDVVNDCNGADRDARGTLHYTGSAVTLTITNSGDAGDVPVEFDGPSLSGSAQEGQTLAVNPGSWQGQTSYSYTWWDCDSSGCSQIPGANAATYVPTSNDLGEQIVAGVSANDAAGSNTDYTDATAVVTAEPKPAASAAPTVSGQTQVGDVLSATTGTWSNSPTSYAYKWERCTATGTSCAAISGATANAYTLATADIGSTIAVQVTATNYGGTGSPAQSATTAVIAAATTPPRPISTATVAAALKAIAKPPTPTALTKLLKHDGYSLSFNAPAAGRLSVTWSTTIKHKTITVATGAQTVTNASTVGVKVKLTAKGKAELKRYRSLRIKSTSHFTATSIPEVTYTTSFTLTTTNRSSHLRRINRTCLRPHGDHRGRACIRGAQSPLLATLGTLRKSSRRRPQRQ